MASKITKVVRDGLRRLEAQKQREAAINRALIEGEESGFKEGDLFALVRAELGLESR